jgi:branched-subunit amino acid aminotransferase/4-amino-4-deoxychorismate lyase
VIAIDGAIVADELATISVLDRGFLYGDGLFEVLRTWRGLAVDLAAHLDRLAASAAALELSFDRRSITATVSELLARTSGDQRLRIVITRGQGGPAMRFAAGTGGQTIIYAEPLPGSPREASAAFVDYPLARRTQGHKTLAYLDHLIAKELAAVVGADEAIRLGPDGDVVEGATSNLFIVRGTIHTPPLAGVLPGVTRGHILECCKALGLAASEDRLTVNDVRQATEIFTTSAVRGVVAITRLDGVTRPDGIGPVTQKLAEAYAARMTRASMSWSRDGS